MTTFLKYMSRAQSTLSRALGPRKTVEQTTSASSVRVASAKDPLAEFRGEFNESWSQLTSDQQVQLTSYFNSPDFSGALQSNAGSITALQAGLSDIFPKFSPLHPVYPMLNAFSDLDVDCGGLQHAGSESIQKIIAEILGNPTS